MTKLRQLSMAVVLTFVLAAPGFAGTIGTSPEAPPPPPEASSATAPGTIGTVPGDTQPAAVTTDPVVSIALGLLQNVLLVF